MEQTAMQQAAAQAIRLLEEQGVRLTPAQRQGILPSRQPTLMLAVPGSGKTTVLVGRVAALLLAGVQPERILNLTFSRESARDMAVRFERFFPQLPAPRFSTIHSLCYSVLNLYARRTGRTIPPLTGSDGQPSGLQIMGEVVRRRDGFVEDEDLEDALNLVGLSKNLMLSREETADLPCALPHPLELLDGYQQRKNELGLMDYDDMLLYTLTFFQKLPWLLQRMQEQYDFIQLDESQDVSRVQLELVKILKPQGDGLFLVGDEDQSIYGFRGAWPRGILDFEALFPGGAVLKMEDNFRSRPEILHCCDHFIRMNRERYPKTIRPSREGRARAVKRFQPATPEELAGALLEQIAVLGPGETVGILYRSSLSALPVIDLLLEAEIPFRLPSSSIRLVRHHLKQLHNLFQLAVHPEDGELLLSLHIPRDLDGPVMDQIAALPPGPAPDRIEKAAEILDDEPAQKLSALLRRLPTLSPEKAMAAVQRETSYGRYFLARSLAPADAIAALRTSIYRQFCRRTRTLPQLLERLERAEAVLHQPPPVMKPAVSLSTIHAAKGLEFDHVWMLDCCEGILPGRIPLERMQSSQTGAFFEEVRLFYVGATRARETLTLVLPAASEPSLRPSRFVEAFFETPSPKKKTPRLFSRPKKELPPLPPMEPGLRICHRSFGPGQVTGVEGDLLRVVFDRLAPGENMKTLSLSCCISAGLIQLEKPNAP